MQSDTHRPPLMIVAGNDQLGEAFARACRLRDLAYVLTSRDEVDVTDEASVAEALDLYRPWAVVNTGGRMSAGQAEQAPDECFAVNAIGAERLARASAARGIATLQFSTDMVFDGAKEVAYGEDDVPNAINVYGRSKLTMEAVVSALPGSHLIVRAAALFSAHEPDEFTGELVDALAAGRRFTAQADVAVCPTYIPDFVRESLDLLIDGATGIWHLTHGEPLSWAEFARRIASVLNADPRLVVPTSSATSGAARPPRIVLTSRRGALLRPLDAALRDYASEVAAREQAYAEVA